MRNGKRAENIFGFKFMSTTNRRMATDGELKGAWRLSRSRVLSPQASRFFLLSLVGCALNFQAHAVLPEPDNVIYGAVYRDGRFVTPADYDVVIEARRTPDGPALVQYQMGSNARLALFYSLRIKLESLLPKADTEASQTNEVIYLVATDYNGTFATTNLVVGSRGTFQRIDLGTPSDNPDADGDGLPDAWELAHGIVGDGSGDKDGDGVSDRNEYLAGTDPSNSGDAFWLSITQSGTNQLVSFFARRSEGAGYEGSSRIYALEYTTNVGLSAWTGVPNQTNILGDNLTHTYRSAGPPPNLIYRGRVRLERP
jgi:hypothetical protein